MIQLRWKRGKGNSMQKERSCHYRKCLKEPNGQMGEIYSSKMGDDFDQCGCIKRNDVVSTW